MRWKVGNYGFDDQSNELIFGQETRLLEPKPAAMLRYFVEHSGKNISRDELMQALWPNQVVSDNAINRVVVQLRKALKDSDKIKRYIVTVPKVGYRFIAECIIDEEPVSMPVVPQAARASIKGNRGNMGILVFALLTLVVSFWIYQQINPPEPIGYSSPQLTPLSRLSELEFGAELAHDNEQLVYTTRGNEGYNVIMYRVSAKARPIRISEVQGHGLNPSWSLNDETLIYVFKNQSVCEFHLVQFKNGRATRPRVVYRCPMASDARFVFSSNKDKVYFTERQSEFSPYYVYELDIQNLSKTRLPQPLAEGRGNHYLDYHAPKDALLVLNESRVGKSSVFSLDIAEKTFNKLIDLDYRVDSAIWGHEPNTIVHPGIHPSYQLVATNIDQGRSQLLLSDSRRISSPKRINNDKDYMFTSYLYNRDITATVDIPASINSAVMDYLPAISHDEKQLAFISKRAGYSQVWLYSIEKQTLTVFDGANDGRMYLSLDWSFDNTKLLANTSLGLTILDVASLQTEHRVAPDSPSYASSWYSDRAITYSTYKGEKWRVHRYDLETKATELLDERWAFVISDGEGHVLIDQQLEFAQNEFTPNYAELCGPILNRFSFTIRLTKNGLYCPAKDDGRALIHFDKAHKVHRLENVLYQAPFYSITENAMANIVLKNSVSDIMRTNF